MSLLSVIPKIFYADIKVGLSFFVDGLGFQLVYNDESLYIVKRDLTTLLLVINEEAASGERPEIRIATDDIHGYYNEIKGRNPQLLHPNLNFVKQQPWGLKEFATLDSTTVCIIFQQE